MKLVVGLGNPGARYARTRHNVGLDVLDLLGERHGISRKEKRFKSELGAGRIGMEPVVLVAPQTFMNLSGEAVGPMVGWYKLGLEDVIVLHDDLDLPFGDVRVKVGGGHGGHNGLRDLLAKLPGPGFVRIRIGVGRPPGTMDPASFVLARWASDEEGAVAGVISSAAEAVESVMGDGTAAAMNRINGEGNARRKTKQGKSDGKGSASAEV